MKLWAEIRKRRVFPFLGGYIAAGFLVLEGVDQLVGNGLMPEVAYPIALIFYLFGIPGTTILAWFHGEKGPQKPPALEIWLQVGLLVVCLAVCYRFIAERQSGAADIAAVAEAGLDSRRVAVLYFEDLSDDAELGYLADGLTEALIARLSEVRSLDVVSRHGVEQFRGSDLPRDSIARILDAGSLIEGSVEVRGDRLRVTTRLVDGVSGADFERRSFELPEGDLIVMRDSLSRDAARFLRARLGEEIRLRETRAETSNPDAWALLQRAERLRKNADELVADDQIAAALAEFARADSILAVAEAADPEWVEPIVLRGQIAYWEARYTFSEHQEFEHWIDVGLQHADRALALAPNNAEALGLRGTLRYVYWVIARPGDPDEADRLLESARSDLEAATRADPSLASAHSTLSHLYYQVEDLPAAVLAARRAYEEDAYLRVADQVLWRLYYGSLDLEQFSQAERWCDEGGRRFPDDHRFVLCKLTLMETPAVPPDVDAAWSLLARVDSLAPESLKAIRAAEGRMTVAGVLARAGLADSARSVLQRARAAVTHEIDPQQELLWDEAYVRILLDEQDEAVELIRRYAAANPGHFGATEISWWWRDLTDHPGFQELLRSEEH